MLCDDLCAAQPTEPAMALAIANVARRVATAARFRLSSDVIALCAKTAAQDPDGLVAALVALRSPHPRLWIEWAEQNQRVGALFDAVDAERRLWSVTLASIGEKQRLMVAPLGFLADGSDAPRPDGTGPGGRVHPAPSPHMQPFTQSLIEQGGMEKLVSTLAPFTKVLIGQSGFLLAALLCAHLHYGVAGQALETSDKLAKARRKAGKPPLLSSIGLDLAH